MEDNEEIIQPSKSIQFEKYKKETNQTIKMYEAAHKDIHKYMKDNNEDDEPMDEEETLNDINTDVNDLYSELKRMYKETRDRDYGKLINALKKYCPKSFE